MPRLARGVSADFVSPRRHRGRTPRRSRVGSHRAQRSRCEAPDDRRDVNTSPAVEQSIARCGRSCGTDPAGRRSRRLVTTMVRAFDHGSGGGDPDTVGARAATVFRHLGEHASGPSTVCVLRKRRLARMEMRAAKSAARGGRRRKAAERPSGVCATCDRGRRALATAQVQTVDGPGPSGSSDGAATVLRQAGAGLRICDASVGPDSARAAITARWSAGALKVRTSRGQRP